MSADFFSIALAVEPAIAAREVRGLAALEKTYDDNVYLDCGPDAVEPLGEMQDGTFVMSPNYPVFVAIDRFACDGALLRGRALLHVRHADLAVWRPKWAAIRDDDSVVERTFEAIDRGYNDDEDVTAAVAAIDQALEAAEAGGLDLVLVCVAT